MKTFASACCLLLAAAGFAAAAEPLAAPGQKGTNMAGNVVKTEAEWKQQLTPEQYRVVRLKGTEAPFTGEYLDTHEPGIYRCVACGAPLFDASHKFESHCGWPSFYEKDGKIAEHVDRSHGMVRTEVVCERCGAHLGHVFEDGPAPTGLRYCINSASLKFEPEEPKK